MSATGTQQLLPDTHPPSDECFWGYQEIVVDPDAADLAGKKRKLKCTPTRKEDVEPPLPPPEERPEQGKVRVVRGDQTFSMRDELLIQSSIEGVFDAETIENVLVPINDKTFAVSMRTIDFFIQRYCIDKDVSFKLDDGSLFVVRESYAEYINVLKKLYFDVFKRTDTLWVDYGKDTLCKTTMGQALVFGGWLLRYGILDYIVRHRDDIVAYEMECKHGSGGGGGGGKENAKKRGRGTKGSDV